jgi:outer membrane receptor protein involved in Fe transport
MRIPRLYHDGGYRSVVHSDFVRAVELVPGGYGASYGRGLGGLVTIGMRPLDDAGFHGSAAVDVIDASVSMRAKVGERWHVAVAGRRSHLSDVVSGVTSTDVADVVPIPRYYDGQARIVYDLAPRETIEIGGLLSSDSIDHTLLSSDPSLQKRETRSLSFWRTYARYENKLKDGSVVNVIPSFGGDRSRLLDQFGGVPTEVDVDSTVLGLRAQWRGQPMAWLGVTVGVDAEATASTLHRAGSIGAPAREGDIRVFGQTPSDQINVDDWKVTFASLAPFIEGDVALDEDRLHVVPGARFEPYVVAGSRATPLVGATPQVGYTTEDTVVEPRIAVRYALTQRMLVKAAYGVYHQSPAAEDRSAVFGTPTLGLSMAKHYLAGGAFKLTPKLSVELTGFLSKSESLVTRSPADSPELAHALDQNGRGRSFGTQLLVRQEQVGRFFGWVSYSLMRSERQDAPGYAYRLFDFDQTHVVTALGSYDLGHGFEVGLRARFASGFPRTPVIGAYYDARSDSYRPLFGAHNSIRIPAFFAVDARIAKRFKAGTIEGEIYLDVQNVTNHKNPEEIVYNAAYTQHDYITGLPVLPVMGARLSW